MTPRQVLVPALSAALLACAACGGSSSAAPTVSPSSSRATMPVSSDDVTMSDTPYGLQLGGGRAFFNNCWGGVYLQQPDLGSCEIASNPDGSVYRWKWSWPAEAVDQLKGYPSVIVGDKAHAPPGFDRATDERFPLPLSRMRALWAGGDLSVNASGSFDFAYDLLFLEGPVSVPAAIRSEIMVWLKTSKGAPATPAGEYSVDGRTYDLYVNTSWNPGVPYLAFVLRGDSLPRRVPLHEFIRIGIEKGYVDAGAHLAAVELGPEIWSGQGDAELRGYELLLDEAAQGYLRP